MKNFDEQKRYDRAKERVFELKQFYNNLFSYTIFISILAGINYYSNQWSNPWFLWAAFGWGIGLIFHALKAFRVNPMFDKNWEERKIRKYMEEDDKHESQQWE